MTIDKPWWASYPAYMAYLLLFLIALAYIYHLIQKRQEKRATESKIDFFITTAHDLLTPLNLIQAPLRDMQQELPAEGKTGQLLDMALSHSSKLTHYVEKLLDFQRISLHASRLVVSAQSLESFLRYRIDSFRLVAGHKFIGVECRFDESARQEIWFDKEKISRILDNLLSNAVKYTPYGGSICIEASADAHKWYLRVRDTGIGISGRDQRMIFRHVFRAANAINSGEIGSGIGLKLVASLVSLHRGKISLRSKLGEGTEFFLSFPMHYEEAVRHTETEQVAPQPPEAAEGESHIHRILIVEDDPEMSRYLMMCLRDQYQVQTCANGKEALEETDRFCPHLIISDLLMPEMTGIELCRRIKGNVKSSHIPVLLLTGVTETESVREGLRAGAIDYMRKPFDKEVLKGKLENIFELQRTAQRQCLDKLKNDNALELSNKTDNEFMEKLLALIEKHIDNPELNISLLCSELALSRTLLYNKITQLTGNAPTEFIRMIRLKRAANLLLSGKHSVTEVAFQVGIDNPKYFSRVFKEFYGVSPREYLARSSKA
ncbi:MAG: response regulator [Bacteroides sp.]|nr:response regulator [Bacteroides sp.]